jgi:CopG family nickel-responsive transcriptional regulator
MLLLNVLFPKVRAELLRVCFWFVGSRQSRRGQRHRPDGDWQDRITGAGPASAVGDCAVWSRDNPQVLAPEEWTKRLRDGDAFVAEVARQPKLFVRGETCGPSLWHSNLLATSITGNCSRNIMEKVARFSVSLDKKLLRDLDRMAHEKGYDNRSLAVADMIRSDLIEHWQQMGKGEIAGSITLVYDHHHHHLQELLTDLQHEHRGVVISVLHCHLDHDNCLELLAVRGQALSIKKLADAMIAAKGVKHGQLTITTTGKDLPT